MSGRRRKGKEELEALRRAVADGKHEVDLDRLAQKLVDHELSRRSMVAAVTRRGRTSVRLRRAAATGTRATPPRPGRGRSRRNSAHRRRRGHAHTRGRGLPS